MNEQRRHWVDNAHAVRISERHLVGVRLHRRSRDVFLRLAAAEDDAHVVRPLPGNQVEREQRGNGFAFGHRAMHRDIAAAVSDNPQQAGDRAARRRLEPVVIELHGPRDLADRKAPERRGIGRVKLGLCTGKTKRRIQQQRDQHHGEPVNAGTNAGVHSESPYGGVKPVKRRVI